MEDPKIQKCALNLTRIFECCVHIRVLSDCQRRSVLWRFVFLLGAKAWLASVSHPGALLRQSCCCWMTW